MHRRRSIFDVFEEISRQINETFEDSFAPYLDFPMQDIKRRELQPLVKITETEDEVIVNVDLPCVKKDGVKTYATDEILRIEASTEKCIKIGPFGNMQKEAEFDKFRKTIRMPVRVRPKEAKARFKNGVLEVRFPKKSRGSRIKIE